MQFILLAIYYLILQSLFDVLFIPGAFGHGTWWLFSALLAKIASSAALASISLVCRRRWPIVLATALLVIWAGANGIYYHATGLYITFDVLTMAQGLHGFTSSIATYFRWDVLLLIGVSLLIIPLLLKTHAEHSWRRFGKAWSVIITCSLLGSVCHYLYWHEHDHPKPRITADYFRPLDLYGDCKPKAWRDGENWYIERHSITMAFPHMFVHALNLHQEEKLNQFITFTPAEKEFLQPSADSNSAISGHLVILLVESLESWALEQTDLHGNEITPCINSFISSHPSLFAKHITCQKRFGESGDGQMIINSGLLPVREGVACMKYADRTYPNFAHLYPASVIVNPVKNAWNQTIMTQRYGYKQLIEPTDVTVKNSWNDAMVMQRTQQILDTASVPTCLMAITISSHTPFDRVMPTLDLAQHLPQDRNHYLQCIHYADSCLGQFLRWTDTAGAMRNATIVITGDHNIFPDGYCPLIISSPSIAQSIATSETYYQMDIFPTILSAIGQKGYFWQGFGADLLAPQPQRRIDTDSAFILSDKLIRSNYFRLAHP